MGEESGEGEGSGIGNVWRVVTVSLVEQAGRVDAFGLCRTACVVGLS